MRKWQANLGDEEINDNFENIMGQDLITHGQNLR